MFDMHNELITFYHEHVRLKGERKRLAELRDLNLTRLNEGLDKLSEQDGVTYAYPLRHRDQGGYAMHTLNQHIASEYDLDCAIIFHADDLPSSALAARQHIAAAFNATGTTFARDPEARTNAVTVWYAEGYHIDFAVYRESVNAWGETVLEHAGAVWQVADPTQMVNWFSERVQTLSPSGQNVTVAAGQLRRVVRWIKKFAKSRTTWRLPGGMILTALAVECYRHHKHRDDVALYETMRAIRDRLIFDQRVRNPLFVDQYLTSKPEYERQVARLKEKLDTALNQLDDVLFAADCTRTQALSAWNSVFLHEYWQDLIDAEETVKSSGLGVGTLIHAPKSIDDTGTYG